MSNPRYGGLCSCGRIAGHGGDCGAPAAFGGNPRLGEALAATRRELAEARAERDRLAKEFKAVATALDPGGAHDRVAIQAYELLYARDDATKRAEAAEASAEKLRGALRGCVEWLRNLPPDLAYPNTIPAAFSGTAAPRGDPDDALLKSQSHEFWQDSKYNRTAGRCDYTYPDGDYCGELASHPVHSSSTTAAAAETAPPPSGPDHSSSPVAVHDLCRPNDGNGSGPERRSAAGETATPRSAGGTAPDVAGGDRAERRPLSPPASAGDNPGSGGATRDASPVIAPAAGHEAGSVNAAVPSSKPEPGAPCCVQAVTHANDCPVYGYARVRAAVPEEPRAAELRVTMTGFVKEAPEAGKIHDPPPKLQNDYDENEDWASPPTISCSDEGEPAAAAPKVEDPRRSAREVVMMAQFEERAENLRARLAALEEVGRQAARWRQVANPGPTECDHQDGAPCRPCYDLAVALAALDSLGGAKEGGT